MIETSVALLVALGALTLACCILCLFLYGDMIWSRRELLDNMVQGLIVVDAQQRLVVWNERFVTMFQLGPVFKRPTYLMPLQEVLATGIDGNPLFKETSAELIAERQRVWAAGKSATVLRELTDGRLISILHAPLPSGGWLTTFEDVTEQRTAESRCTRRAANTILIPVASNSDSSCPASCHGCPV
jgi:PAS domain-containing protein